MVERVWGDWVKVWDGVMGEKSAGFFSVAWAEFFLFFSPFFSLSPSLSLFGRLSLGFLLSPPAYYVRGRLARKQKVQDASQEKRGWKSRAAI